MVRDIDINTMTAKSPVEGLGAEDLVALAAFKNPGIKVLDLGGFSPVAMCEETDLISYTVAISSNSEVAERSLENLRFRTCCSPEG